MWDVHNYVRTSFYFLVVAFNPFVSWRFHHIKLATKTTNPHPVHFLQARSPWEFLIWALGQHPKFHAIFIDMNQIPRVASLDPQTCVFLYDYFLLPGWQIQSCIHIQKHTSWLNHRTSQFFIVKSKLLRRNMVFLCSNHPACELNLHFLC